MAVGGRRKMEGCGWVYGGMGGMLIGELYGIEVWLREYVLMTFIWVIGWGGRGGR